MEPHIRRISIDDYDDILRVWTDAGLPIKPAGREQRELLARELTQPFCAGFGLLLENRLIGVALANWDGRRGWINRLAIDPEHRGRGYAGVLIRECERFLSQQGALVLAGLIEEENLPSMAAFAKEGYACVTEIRLFRKRLRPDA